MQESSQSPLADSITDECVATFIVLPLFADRIGQDSMHTRKIVNKVVTLLDYFLG